MAKKVDFQGVEFSKCRWVLNSGVVHIQVRGAELNRAYGLALNIRACDFERAFPMTAEQMLEWFNAGQAGEVISRAGTGRAYTRGLIGVGENTAGQVAVVFVRNESDVQGISTVCGTVGESVLDWIEAN